MSQFRQSLQDLLDFQGMNGSSIELDKKIAAALHCKASENAPRIDAHITLSIVPPLTEFKVNLNPYVPVTIADLPCGISAQEYYAGNSYFDEPATKKCLAALTDGLKALQYAAWGYWRAENGQVLHSVPPVSKDERREAAETAYWTRGYWYTKVGTVCSYHPREQADLV